MAGHRFGGTDGNFILLAKDLFDRLRFADVAKTGRRSVGPNLIMRHDSPMELLDVAQAVTMHMFGPRNPNSIEITPLAMLLMSIGMVKAETRCGPLFINTLNWSSSVFSPPMPLLTITPMRS